jgi:hypothetical protein
VIPARKLCVRAILQAARHCPDGDGGWVDFAIRDSGLARVVAIVLRNQYYGVPVAIREISCTSNFSKVIDVFRLYQMQARTGDGKRV